MIDTRKMGGGVEESEDASEEDSDDIDHLIIEEKNLTIRKKLNNIIKIFNTFNFK